jgi:hypothetical protein
MANIHDNWSACKDVLPPVDVVVETKIDDAHGVRNVTTLKRYQREPTTRSLWFMPDGSMYVYYEPTHWRPAHAEGANQ